MPWIKKCEFKKIEERLEILENRVKRNEVSIFNYYSSAESNYTMFENRLKYERSMNDSKYQPKEIKKCKECGNEKK